MRYKKELENDNKTLFINTVENTYSLPMNIQFVRKQMMTDNVFNK